MEPIAAVEKSPVSIWISSELPILIATAIVLLAVILWLIWCLCDINRVYRDTQTNSSTSRRQSHYSDPEACYGEVGTTSSSVTVHTINGLQNLGNTCYFNAAIQCLSQTNMFQRKLQESLTTGDLTEQFINLLNAMNRESDSVLVKTKILHAEFCSRAPKFRGYRQHDSHEFLRNFLHELRKEETDLIPSMKLNVDRTPKVIDQIFGGHQITLYTCDRCHTPYHIFEPMLDISLPVRTGTTAPPPSEVSFTSDDPYRRAVNQLMKPLSVSELNPGLDRNQTDTTRTTKQRSVDDSLGYFTRVEHIDDEYLCKECSRAEHEYRGNEDVLKTSATKQTLIFNPPAMLTLHLKRFELTPGRRSKKVNDWVKFDELLDIAPYCSSRCMRNNDPPTQNLWYSLYGVVVHQSELLTSGHYIAFVKVRREEDQKGVEKFLQKHCFDRDITGEQLVEMMAERWNQPTERCEGVNSRGVWYLVNDSYVTEVTLDIVLKQEAYMLFYERL